MTACWAPHILDIEEVYCESSSFWVVFVILCCFEGIIKNIENNIEKKLKSLEKPKWIKP
jgi:hypothetical protein